MIALIGAAALSYSAMVALCQGLPRHFQAVWQRPLGSRWSRVLRAYGWTAPVAALWLCAVHWGWPMAGVGELGVLSVSAFTLVLGLPYWPRLVVAAGLGAGVVGIALFAYSLWF